MATQLTVPTKALSLAGESGEDVAPEAGDRVTVTVEGTVNAVNGDSATIDCDTANGLPCGESSSMPEGKADMGPEGTSLRDAWATQDKENPL
jgi:hypothetical protein